MNEDWLKENYEKAFLIAATVIAVGLTAWLILGGLKFGDLFDQASVRQSHEMPETGFERLEQASKAFEESVLWQGDHLFVSAPVLERDGALEPVGEGFVHHPISDAWVSEHNLPMTESDIKEQDPDGDRFTNLEEFLGETDPNDADSHPAFITKLRLASMVDSDLQLVFQTQVDPSTWQIDQVSPGGKFDNRNLLVGKTKRFGPNKQFRLDGFEEKRGVDVNGVPVDESVVTISYVEAGGNARVNQELKRGEPWTLPTHEGNLIDQFDGSEITAKRGSSFKLNNDPDTVFTVVEVNEEMAILKDQNGNNYRIRPL